MTDYRFLDVGEMGFSGGVFLPATAEIAMYKTGKIIFVNVETKAIRKEIVPGLTVDIRNGCEPVSKIHIIWRLNAKKGILLACARG